MRARKRTPTTDAQYGAQASIDAGPSAASRRRTAFKSGFSEQMKKQAAEAGAAQSAEPAEPGIPGIIHDPRVGEQLNPLPSITRRRE